jgi:hypothetical protein
LSNQQLKGTTDVLVVSSAGFGPAALDLLGDLLAVLGSDLSLLGPEIALIADNDDWHGFRALDAPLSVFQARMYIESTHEVVEDFLANHLHHLKRGQRPHRVDQHVTMDSNKML